METYPKQGKSAWKRSSRPNKRHYYGVKKENKEEKEEEGTSASARKLVTAGEEVPTRPMHFYRIIEFISVFSALSNFSICKDCKKTITFNETSNQGLGFQIVAECACSVNRIKQQNRRSRDSSKMS